MTKTDAPVAPPTNLLPDGLVPVAAYHQLLADPSFADLEAFSDHFTAETKASSQDYARRWNADSFHQWSRVWGVPVGGLAAGRPRRRRRRLTDGPRCRQRLHLPAVLAGPRAAGLEARVP